MSIRKIALLPLIACFYVNPVVAQSVSYSPLFDNITFSRSIDLSKPVGAIEGAAGTTPSGAATYTIPIKTPPGTNGMAPQLSIVYNSQGGNGILGQGWSLSGLSVITRAGKDFYHDGKVSPATYTNDDAFILDGQRLVPTSGSNGAPGTTYRTEAESYSITTSLGTIGSDPHYFTVRTKDGSTMEYGFAEDARISYTDGKIMMWRLNKIQDLNGNYILFTYDNTDGESKLIKVTYTGNLSVGTAPYNEINFHYVDRPDKTYIFSGEDQYYAASLLHEIEIKEIDGSIFKRYEFSYGTDLINSYLKSVEEIAATGSRLNDTRFLYGQRPSSDVEVAETNLAIGEEDRLSSGDFNGDGIVDILKISKGSGGYTDMYAYFTPYASATYTLGKSMTGISDLETYGSASSYDRTGYVASDYDGDGRDEVLALSSYRTFGSSVYDKCRLHTPDKASSITLTKEIAAPPFPNDVPGTGRRFLAGDFDGDRRTDYLLIVWEWTDRSKVPWKGRCKAYINFPSKGIYNSPVELSHATDMDFDWPNRFNSWRDVHVMDYDGDGKAEIFGMNDRTYAVVDFKAKPGTTDRFFVSQLVGGTFPEADADVLGVGDFNGDGKTDLLTRYKDAPYASKIAYSRGLLGVGGSAHFYLSPFSFDKPYDKECSYWKDGVKVTKPGDQVYIADYNNDGKSDILHLKRTCSAAGYSASTTLDLFISNFGFVLKSYTVTGSIRSDLDPIVGDMNGDGKADFTFVKDNGGALKLYTLYFRKGSTSHLLQKVTDGYNRTTEFTYDPLTKGGDIFSKGSGSAYPLNNAQYPMYVVTSLKAPDGIGGIVNTEFRYENLVIHRLGRGLLGFEKIKSTNFTTDIRTETTYGLNGDFYVPYVSNVKTFQNATGTQLSYTTQKITFNRLSSGYRFSQANASGSSEDLLSGTISAYSNTYDADGNITNSTSTLNGDVTITTETASSYIAVGGSGLLNAPSETTVTITRSGSPSVTDKTILEYDAKGRLAHSYTNPNGILSPETIHRYWSYDDYGNKTMKKEFSVAASYTPVTYYEYDPTGRFVTKQTNALGDYTEYTTHKFWGKPLSVTGLNGLTASYTYDAWGRLRSETVPVDAASFYARTYSEAWDPGSNQLYYTLLQDPAAPDVQTWYDMMDREVKTRREHFSGAWTNTLSSYDARGNVLRKTNEHLSSETPLQTEYTYDEHNRVASETSIAGTTKYRYEFSGGSALTTITLPDGKIKKTKTDASGKLIESGNGMAGTVVFAYDSRGNELQASMKVFSGTAFPFVRKEYDSRGRLVKLDDADAGATTYKYNAFGKLKEQKDAKGKITTFTYGSGLGLLQQKVLDGITTKYTYYDKLKGYQLQQESVTSTAYGTVADEYDYNESGTLARHSRNTNGVIIEKTFGYDAYGRPLTTAYSSGLRTRQHYRANGVLEKITTDFSGGGPGEQLLYRADEMRGDGQVKKFTRSNGLQTELSYDNGYLSRIRDASGILDIAMDYNFANGNLWARGDLRAKTQEFFSYDAADRLTSSVAEQEDASGSVRTWPAIDIEYDVPSPYWTGSYGRIVSKSDAGQYGYRPFPRNAVSTITDPGGLVSHATQEITYTPFHKADKITETISGTPYEENFVYDAGEDRAYSAQVQGGVLTHQRWYMGDYEQDQFAGSAVQQIHYISGDAGLSAIVVEEGGSFTYYTAYTDHLGSIVLLTDDAGTPVYRQAYDPWGRERDPETWNYGVAGSGTKPRWLTRGYTGHEMLPEYGLINMNGRMYDPLNGRMLRPDNYVQDPTNTQNYNRFSYCLNNPMKYTDPSGDQYNTSNYSYGYSTSYGASGNYYGVPYSLSYSASFNTYNNTYLNTYNNGLFIQTYSTNIWGFNSSQSFSASYGNMSASWSVNFSSKIETTALVETKVNPVALEGFRLNFESVGIMNKMNTEAVSNSLTRLTPGGEGSTYSQQNGSGVLDWMNKHFDVAIGYSTSYGAQLGGGIQKGIAARINFYSTVQTDFEWSLRKGFEGNSYAPGKKINWGIGGAYYGGLDYKGQAYKGATEHEVGIGIIGVGVKLKFDNYGNMTDWFWGFDPSLNMQFGVGVEGNFRIGFSKR